MKEAVRFELLAAQCRQLARIYIDDRKHFFLNLKVEGGSWMLRKELREKAAQIADANPALTEVTFTEMLSRLGEINVIL